MTLVTPFLRLGVLLNEAENVNVVQLGGTVHKKSLSVLGEEAARSLDDCICSKLFFGVDGMDGILDMPGFDTTLAEGLVLMTPFCATVESSKSFVDAYVAAYGTTPNQFAADAYDGVYIVKAALEQAGCTADMSNEELCDALVSAITSLKFTGLTGTDMTWNAEGQVSKAPTAYVVKDGQYVEG